jgi:hypothetical protein
MSSYKRLASFKKRANLFYLRFDTSRNLEGYESLDAMNLREDLLRGIYGYGYEKPSTIQQYAIMPIIQGRDCIVEAQSRTGKTATSKHQLPDASVPSAGPGANSRAGTTDREGCGCIG